MERCTGQGMGKRAPPSHATSKCCTHSTSPRVHQPRSFLNPSIWDYMKASLHQHDWLNHWPLVINLTIRPSPFLGNQGVGLKIPPYIYKWFLWQPAPNLRCFQKLLHWHKLWCDWKGFFMNIRTLVLDTSLPGVSSYYSHRIHFQEVMLATLPIHQWGN